MRSVAILALGVFAVGTGEFVLAGMLPMLVEAFDISIAQAGQIVTVFALTCAISAPIFTTITAAWQRRSVLVTATLIYLGGAIGTAVAGSFSQIIAAQVVAAIGVGLFIPNASVAAASLVDPKLRGRAIAIVISGFAAAVAIGAPLGTALGGIVDWRTTMWFTAGLAVIGLGGVLAFIPRDLEVPSAGGLRDRMRPLKDRHVLSLLATTLIGYTAVFVPYTYIGVIYEPATGGSSISLAILMLTAGLTGAAGSFIGGYFTDKIGGTRVVTVALLWLGLGLLLVPLATTNFAAAMVVVALYAGPAFALNAPQQHRLITARPDATAVVIALNQSVLYLAIAASGLLGALGIDLLGTRYVSIMAAVLAVLALGFSIAARRTSPQPRKPEVIKELVNQ